MVRQIVEEEQKRQLIRKMKISNKKIKEIKGLITLIVVAFTIKTCLLEIYVVPTGSMEKTILAKKVTYDFERLMQGATLLKCSEFGDALIENM